MGGSFRIGDLQVSGDGASCIVIAEIGHNHQGSVEKAKELFNSAKACGVNAVKLQKRDNRFLYTRKMYDAPYDNENSFGPTYGAHREALEFGRRDYLELQSLARRLGLIMFATAFDIPSADFLAELDMPAYKIASGDLKNIPLLKHVAMIGKPMFVSTGGGTMEDVERAYDTVMSFNPQLCLMQCTASYPVEAENMNLRVINSYMEKFPKIPIGISDHQNGIAMAVLAYALGARVIEKHFTLSRAWKGTDHAFSLEPQGLHKLVRDLMRAKLAMGDGVKRPYPCEEKALFKMGKKLVVVRNLPPGHVLTPEDIGIKSPNDGLPPYEIKRVVGKVTLRALKEDENVSFDDLSDGKK